MRIGGFLVLLALAAGACFSDHTPGGLSTASGTSTGDSTTTGTSSSGAVTTGSATTGATQTGSTGTGGTTDPGTSTTTTGVATTTTTGDDPSTGTSGPPDVSECGQEDSPFTCQACCREAVPGSLAYYGAVAECACEENSPCLADCAGDLCFDKTMDEACFNCVFPMANEPCSLAAAQLCLADPECAPFVQCIGEQQCLTKSP